MILYIIQKLRKKYILNINVTIHVCKLLTALLEYHYLHKELHEKSFTLSLLSATGYARVTHLFFMQL